MRFYLIIGLFFFTSCSPIYTQLGLWDKSNNKLKNGKVYDKDGEVAVFFDIYNLQNTKINRLMVQGIINNASKSDLTFCLDSILNIQTKNYEITNSQFKIIFSQYDSNQDDQHVPITIRAGDSVKFCCIFINRMHGSYSEFLSKFDQAQIRIHINGIFKNGNKIKFEEYDIKREI